MNSAKVIKSSRIYFLVILIMGIFLLFNNCKDPSHPLNIAELKIKGYVDLTKHDSSLVLDEGVIIKLNNKKSIDYISSQSYNQNIFLSSIPTTLIPNKDGVLSQEEWKSPGIQEFNLNYLYVDIKNSADSFYVPLIADFKEISKGQPILFIYIDSSDYFSNERGIYVPGINADPKDIKKKGNYAMRGIDWERKTYYQLFESSGELIDQGWTGSRIHGNLSRAAPQKSIRFYGRSKYGKERFTPPYSDTTSLPRFILRTPFASNGGLIYKDAMISEIALKMGMDAMRSTPVSVYLNGEYWGFFNYRDRLDDHYFFEKYDIDTLDYVDMWARAKYGSPEDYKKAYKWLMKNDLRINENYDSLLTTLNLKSYTRYLLIELFFGNRDWPHNNVRFWRSSELDNKWRWMIYDLDASGNPNVDMATFLEKRIEQRKNNWSTTMLIGILANELFYENLISEYLILKESEFNLKYLQHKADSLFDLYEPLIPSQANRWHFPSSVEHFEKVHDDYLDFLEYRDRVFIEEMARLHAYAIKYQEEKFGVLSR